ncbi:hypothetical protein [Dissulfurimicrobium sp.]|uniref:hypothetical protein n=1 Tax=Dissulfurimicrobium sp. TaxID=2022436 RepID=UPI003D0EC379
MSSDNTRGIFFGSRKISMVEFAPGTERAGVPMCIKSTPMAYGYPSAALGITS